MMNTVATRPRVVVADKGIIERRHRVAHEAANRGEEFGLDPAYRPCSVCMPDAYRAWKNRQRSRSD